MGDLEVHDVALLISEERRAGKQENSSVKQSSRAHMGRRGKSEYLEQCKAESACPDISNQQNSHQPTPINQLPSTHPTPTPPPLHHQPKKHYPRPSIESNPLACRR